MVIFWVNKVIPILKFLLFRNFYRYVLDNLDLTSNHDLILSNLPSPLSNFLPFFSKKILLFFNLPQGI